MTTVCIVDIDTTLANNDHRAALLLKDLDGKITQESWDAFLQADLMVLDTPQKHAKEVVDYMRNHEYLIVFLTGRNEKHYEATRKWLQSHMGWVPGKEPLLMRTSDFAGVAASKFKEAAFLRFVEERRLRNASFLFFEDDKHVMAMWRKYGLVFQCPEAWQWMNPEAPANVENSWSR